MNAEQSNIQDEPSAATGDSLVSILLAIPRLFLVVFMGWTGLLLRLLRLSLDLLRGLPFFQLLFLFSCLALFLTAVPPWIAYQVNFSSAETVYTGSARRILFALPAITGIALAFVAIPWRLPLYLLFYLACAGVYVLGFISPNPVHTYILNAEDYRLTFWIYAYGVPLVGCGLFAKPGLAVAIIDWSQLFSELPEDR